MRRDAAYCTSRLNIAQLSSLYNLNDVNPRNETTKNHLHLIISQPCSTAYPLCMSLCVVYLILYKADQVILNFPFS